MNYYCTWCIQNYSYGCGKPDFDPKEAEGSTGAMHARESMNLDSILGENGWAKKFHPAARKGLFFLLDDGWDVPDPVDVDWFGSLIPDKKRFPTAQREPWERLAWLNERLKAEGWRGLGLWIAAQETPALYPDGLEGTEQEKYWMERMQWSERAGVRYWKVDWGRKAGDLNFRARLTRWAKEYAPNLVIEHAVCQGPINEGENSALAENLVKKEASLLMDADVVRTYDVLQPLSTAQTLERVSALLHAMQECKPRGKAFINCEDECYLAAAMGLYAGVMRHPRYGLRAKGDLDCFFPYPADDAKLRMDEVTRMVNWQEIMPPFGATDESVSVDDRRLADQWRFSTVETWKSEIIGKVVSQTAPARISRGMPLPDVVSEGEPPFVASASHGDAAAVAILPRTLMKKCMPLADIVLPLPKNIRYVAVFGECRMLRIPNVQQAWARDLLGEEWFKLDCGAGELVMTGDDIRKIGLACATTGDHSMPGLMIRFHEGWETRGDRCEIGEE